MCAEREPRPSHGRMPVSGGCHGETTDPEAEPDNRHLGTPIIEGGVLSEKFIVIGVLLITNPFSSVSGQCRLSLNCNGPSQAPHSPGTHWTIIPM